MSNDLNERFVWATEMMTLGHRDTVLEIGCGHGIAVEIIAGRIASGKIVAVDQSRSMTKKAAARIAGLGYKNVAFHTNAFSEMDFKGQTFNKIFAFNVNIFLKKPGKDIEMIRKILAKGGKLAVFYQNPPGADVAKLQSMVRSVEQHLSVSGFEILKRVKKSFAGSPPAAGVIATLSDSSLK